MHVYGIHVPAIHFLICNWKAMDKKLHVHVCFIEEKIPKIFLDFLIQKGFDITINKSI